MVLNDCLVKNAVKFSDQSIFTVIPLDISVDNYLPVSRICILKRVKWQYNYQKNAKRAGPALFAWCAIKSS